MNVNTQANIQSAGINSPSFENQTQVQEKFNRIAQKETSSSASEITKENAKEIVDALSELSETLQTKLNFSVHEQTNDIVVKVIEKDTDRVIRQIPPEEMIELHEKMKDLSGFLLNSNA